MTCGTCAYLIVPADKDGVVRVRRERMYKCGAPKIDALPKGIPASAQIAVRSLNQRNSMGYNDGEGCSCRVPRTSQASANQFMIGDCRFVRMIEGEPEQYRVFVGDERIGHAIVNGGKLRMVYTGYDDPVCVYSASVAGSAAFASKSERMKRLSAAADELIVTYARHRDSVNKAQNHLTKESTNEC